MSPREVREGDFAAATAAWTTFAIVIAVIAIAAILYFAWWAPNYGPGSQTNVTVTTPQPEPGKTVVVPPPPQAPPPPSQPSSPGAGPGGSAAPQDNHQGQHQGTAPKDNQ